MDEKKAFEIVLNKLKECKIFTGVYDASHGKTDFMYGVSTVMDFIAYSIDDETGDSFSEEFFNNMNKSEFGT